MPDIVDALLWPIRGELGQGIGHSLIGVVFLSVPLGLIATKLVRRYVPKKWLLRFDRSDFESPCVWWRAPLSIGVGALSHVFFDLITHANFVLLLPWYRNDDLFPAWWRHAWVEIPLVVYRKPYPIGPHFVAWTILSIAGVVLFLRAVSLSHARVTTCDRQRST